MRKKIKLLKKSNQITFFYFASLLFWMLQPFKAEASNNKIDFEIGGYSLVAQSGTTSGNISSFGIYHIGYRRAVHPRIDIGIGYTLLFTKIVTGDTGFGLDINGTYYFLGASSLVESQGTHSYLTYYEDFRPFVSLNFAQRNYQSIQTSYAGFGGALGLEKSIAERLSLRALARYSMLSAGSDASAKELSFLGGLTIEF